MIYMWRLYNPMNVFQTPTDNTVTIESWVIVLAVFGAIIGVLIIVIAVLLLIKRYVLIKPPYESVKSIVTSGRTTYAQLQLYNYCIFVQLVAFSA